jgi:hypothetical protein
MQGIVDLDALTGTPRLVARIDGFLTRRDQRRARSTRGRPGLRQGPRRRPRSQGRPRVDGLGAAQTRTAYVEARPTSASSSRSAGSRSSATALKAHVAKDGRLVEVDGSPVSALPDQHRRGEAERGRRPATGPSPTSPSFAAPSSPVVKTELSINRRTTSQRR